MTNPYEDIIHLSRPESRRAKMTLLNRAAQFTPFAALTGHDAVIRETGRLMALFIDEISREWEDLKWY